MQGLDINSGGNSVYGNANDPEDNYATQHLHQPTPSDLANFDHEVPQPPNDNNQVAAWYDTDL